MRYNIKGGCSGKKDNRDRSIQKTVLSSERSFSHLLSFLLELLNGSLVDTTALVDQVTSSSRLAGIYVSNDDDVYVVFLFTHVE